MFCLYSASNGGNINTIMTDSFTVKLLLLTNDNYNIISCVFIEYVCIHCMEVQETPPTFNEIFSIITKAESVCIY